MECLICNQNTLREEEKDIFYCSNCGDSFYYTSDGILTSYPGRMPESVKNIVRQLYIAQRKADYYQVTKED